MRSNAGRILIGAALVIGAVVLLLVLKDSGGSGTATSPPGSASEPAAGAAGSDRSKKARDAGVPTVVIRDGKPVGGIAELTYSEGDRIRFRVKSDVSDEVHVHGYDEMKDVEAGGSVNFDFPATIEGVFEAELENRGEQILELRVNP